MKILNPGCGLGRLTYEIACLGFDSIGIEFDYFMIQVSQFFLSNSDLSRKFSLYPYIHSFNNKVLFEDSFIQIQVPDISES